MRTGFLTAAVLIVATVLAAATAEPKHGGGLNACGCHHDRRSGTCHCHRDSGCGCDCEPARCHP